MNIDSENKVCDVLLKIANKNNLRYTELPQIDNYIDMESLTILMNSDSNVSISFTYINYQITWDGNRNEFRLKQINSFLL